MILNDIKGLKWVVIWEKGSVGHMQKPGSSYAALMDI